jgi:hypothetical protein
VSDERAQVRREVIAELRRSVMWSPQQPDYYSLEHTFDCVYGGGVPDERAEVRREVIAELEILALQHAARHEELHQTAVEHGRDEMAQRALANQTAWLEVARVLRSEMSRR